LLLELGMGFALVGSQSHLAVGDQDFYLNSPFYSQRRRCFVVIDLKVDEFKPEYAGKMNFYLSAVDDLLRHPADAPSIGLILCQGRNEVIVEYALRDAAKPMGVAGYRVSSQLPARLEAELPTADELAREFPLMALIRLRTELERALRQAALQLGLADPAPGIGSLLRRLQEDVSLPPSAARFGETMRILNAAAHGADVPAVAANAALEAGTRLVNDLRALRELE